MKRENPWPAPDPDSVLVHYATQLLLDLSVEIWSYLDDLCNEHPVRRG